MSEDIRWLQRLQGFSKVQAWLDEAMDLMQARTLPQLEKLGVIQAFEQYAH